MTLILTLIQTTAFAQIVCDGAVRSAILATAWLLVYVCHLILSIFFPAAAYLSWKLRVA